MRAIDRVLDRFVGQALRLPGNRRGCPTISITTSIGEALDRARANPNPILITGSLHFAGEVLADLRGEPAAFEECAQ